MAEQYDGLQFSDGLPAYQFELASQANPLIRVREMIDQPDSFPIRKVLTEQPLRVEPNR
mgnify:CR=1 FL=1